LNFWKFSALALGVLAGSAMPQVTPEPLSRTAAIVNQSRVSTGTVTVSQAPQGILIRIEASGLTPGWHGADFHSVADCSDAGFKASGGHVHATGPAGSVHGLLNPAGTDQGDLPNIFAGNDGRVKVELLAPSLSLQQSGGRQWLLDADGSALVIHAGADDYRLQPIGGAGARVACAVIH
jgi:superoxide dismutase, Cu-Zn family